MSMSEELEALERISTIKEYVYEDEINLIKSALEDKEKLKKAWKIVCEKNVDMFTLRYCNALFDYQVELMKEGIHTDLTEEEFNLLKEMIKYYELFI